MASPIGRMINESDLRCTVCGAKYGECDCWTKCKKPGCTWVYRKGTKCRNPEHKQFRKRVTPRKREYLRALNDLEWHSATDVAALLQVACSGAAKVLSDLAQMKLVVWQAPDAYAITKAGQEALADGEKGNGELAVAARESLHELWSAIDKI